MPKKRKPATPRRPAPKPLPEPLPPNPPPIPVRVTSTIPAHLYEVRPRKDKRGVDLISGALPFGRLWYDGPNAWRRQPGQPPSGASAGISDPHFEQTLGALIIGGESLTRSLSFLLRKMLSEVTPALQQLNREAADAITL
jgi:hypothetical protein